MVVKSESVSNYMQQLRAWKRDGPLYKWRKEHGATLSEVASSIDVTVTSIQKWEDGAIPLQENMEKLTKLVGDGDFPDIWLDWLEKKPVL